MTPPPLKKNDILIYLDVLNVSLIIQGNELAEYLSFLKKAIYLTREAQVGKKKHFLIKTWQ